MESRKKTDIEVLADKIAQLSENRTFWETKVGSYPNNNTAYPDGVNQIRAERVIVDLQQRLQKIGSDAETKRSSTSLAEWFHSFFRLRHPATEEFYRILSKLCNFKEQTVIDVTNELNVFEKKYSLADNQKKETLAKLIGDILQETNNERHPLHKNFTHAGRKKIQNYYAERAEHSHDFPGFDRNFLVGIYNTAKENHSSVAPLHRFFSQIPDPKLNEFYSILRELKELDNHTVDNVTQKLQQFQKDHAIKPDKTLHQVL